ncbi:helix-turn-helix domain-containing protein [Devosia sp. XJ19-1]|uniref:Helix-turn-helix domain-containing protein n=1 Tax=Devosia ureilytica TaxID=2952754 RepID=A0A9Q4ANH4_9HYPH|nr:helix-turn-helix transcriptional regulator [Devosia ureilytica]MCP8882816.1 helix-turn-helix domain-containing protein [Devosia ureilytica]MCP8886816.1 helix-turn-helix domain-containing protein [Devosia ureilytica]
MEVPKRPMINDALRLLRLYLGLSQNHLASALELSQSTISEIESGTKSVTMEVLERYSSKFDVRMSQLLFFAEELQDQPVKTKGKLIVAPRVLSLLELLAPKEIADAS